MLTAARKVLAITSGQTREDLDNDEVLSLAVVRLLEILGEAAKNVSDSLRDQHGSIPWKQIAGTRDRLIHGYFEVDLDIVWSIIRDDLRPLIERVEQILAGGGGSP